MAGLPGRGQSSRRQRYCHLADT